MPGRDDVTPIHNTGTFAVFADSSREWAIKCREISKDPTREMKAVRLPAAQLAVRLEAAAVVFKAWLEHPDRRPVVTDRLPIVAEYQELVGETVKFLGGLAPRPPAPPPVSPRGRGRG